MLPAFKTKRSAGTPVTPAVHRLLRAANAARDRGAWTEAAAGYRRALWDDAGLGHIWLQLGNMLKEADALAEAEQAYAEAARLRPADPEPRVQLGIVFSRTGRRSAAARMIGLAFEAAPDRPGVVADLHRALAFAPPPERAALLASLRRRLGEKAPTVGAVWEAPDLALDVSDLLAFWAYARLPTGIQRVQIQIALHALQRPGAAVCAFAEGRDVFLPLDPARFREAAALSLAGRELDDPAWLRALHRLHAAMAAAAPAAFKRGGFLVGLGSSWQLHNYFLAVREAKGRYGVRFAPLVYDLAPVVTPEHFTSAARRDFLPWVPAMLDHADALLAISEATKRDLLRIAVELGRPVDPRTVAVIPLDADGRAGAPPSSEAALARWGLRRGGFVLFTATVEPRKGHVVALDAWSRLLARHGAATPPLVCAGRRGWLSDEVYGRLEADVALAGRVVMLGGVGDADLRLLYDACLFSIYPSLYEGWGLPVTEALCHGKAVVTTDAASLPEAGGAFAAYVAPGDADALADAVERLAFDPDHLGAAEARIRAGFRPRGWDEVAGQIADQLARRAGEEGAAPVAPVIRLGAWRPFARAAEPRLRAASGEVFRTGEGWSAPDGEGVRVRDDVGALAIGVPPERARSHVALLLLGAPRGEAAWRLEVEGRAVLSGVLAPNARRWVRFDSPPCERLDLVLHSVPISGGEEVGTAGLVGLIVFAAHDLAARLRWLEAVTLDGPAGADALDVDGD